MVKKKIVYIDMDGVLCDYIGRCNELNINPDEAKHVKGFFETLKPIKNAIESYHKLNEKYDCYILTCASWSNPHSFVEKINWINKYLPIARKRVIFTHNKNLNDGDYLIDDRPVKGSCEFNGEWIHFGTAEFSDWNKVLNYLGIH